MSKAASAVNLSSKEAQLVVAVLQHMAVADFKTDWDSVATQAGYKDAKNAKIMFGRFRDKLLKGAGGANGTDESGAPAGGVDKSSPTKKSPGRPKKVTPGNDGSPKKGAKGGVKKEHLDEDEEMGESEAETIKAETIKAEDGNE